MLFRTDFNRRKPTLSEALALAPIARQHPRYRGCVGHWGMVEGGGGRAWDLSGQQNHGTMTNMDPATDWVFSNRGSALEFAPGSSNFIDCGLVFEPAANDYTLFAEGETTSSGNVTLVRRDPDTGATQRTLSLIDFSGSGTARFYQERISASGPANLTDAGSYNDGNYHTLCGINRSDVSYLLVDGVQKATTGYTDNLTPNPTNNWTIGGWAPGGTYKSAGWDGSIRHVRIYNRGISHQEAHSLHSYPWLEWVWAAELYNAYYTGKAPAAAAGLGIPIASYHYEHHLGR